MLRLPARRSILLGAIIATTASSAVGAQAVTYIGGDNNVSSLSQMVNAQAAAASFLAVAGSLNSFGFETPIPAGLTVSGGDTRNTSPCGPLCGFNTTVGGSFFRYVEASQVTFTFDNPVDAFGFFVNGLQTNIVPQQVITYVDGSSVTRTINMPSAIDGGGAFIGFIDFGQLISSVTFDTTNDFLGFDDLRFGRSENDPTLPSVPEPSTYALMAAGLAGLFAVRRKSKSV